MATIFNGSSALITLDSPILDVNELWSDWVNWMLTGDNSKFPLAFNQVGGNPIDLSSGTSIPLYYFLINGWRIKPMESDHTLTVSGGIILVDGSGDPFIDTVGAFTVRINYQQPVQAITVSTGGGGGFVGPTASDIATAVWAKMAAQITTVGSIGELLISAEQEAAKEASLVVINEGVKKASKLIPHSADI